MKLICKEFDLNNCFCIFKVITFILFCLCSKIVKYTWKTYLIQMTSSSGRMRGSVQSAANLTPLFKSTVCAVGLCGKTGTRIVLVLCTPSLCQTSPLAVHVLRRMKMRRMMMESTCLTALGLCLTPSSSPHTMSLETSPHHPLPRLKERLLPSFTTTYRRAQRETARTRWTWRRNANQRPYWNPASCAECGRATATSSTAAQLTWSPASPVPASCTNFMLLAQAVARLYRRSLKPS